MSTALPPRLGVNVDHVATIRNARGGTRPDPVRAALAAIEAGADGITAHLREDRRHIRDDDMVRLKAEISKPLNFEMAVTDEMVRIALATKPHAVCLVPERREEVTTEGGLDVTRDPKGLRSAIEQLAAIGVRTSLFIDPDVDVVSRSRDLGAVAIELHTGRYAHHPNEAAVLRALEDAAREGHQMGLAVHAGHGLTTSNVGPVAAIAEIEELNIGHSIVSRAVFVGLSEAVREMRAVMDVARTRG
jgi:pyridoxine 5-phosphate synthase